MRGGCIPAFQAALTRTRPVFRRSHALGVVAGARAFTRCALKTLHETARDRTPLTPAGSATPQAPPPRWSARSPFCSARRRRTPRRGARSVCVPRPKSWPLTPTLSYSDSRSPQAYSRSRRRTPPGRTSSSRAGSSDRRRGAASRLSLSAERGRGAKGCAAHDLLESPTHTVCHTLTHSCIVCCCIQNVLCCTQGVSLLRYCNPFISRLF